MHSYSNSSSGGSQRSLHAKRPTSEQLLRQRQAAQHSAAAALDDTTNLPSKRRRLAIEDDASQASSLKLGPDWDGNESTFTQPGSTPNYHAASSMPPPPSSIFQTSSNPLDLSHVQWGLRREIVLGFKGAGIEQMYPWQAECLQLPNLLEGTKNVVYTAPTSGGKSFVADMLVIKRVLEQQKKALVVLPYIAIVQEKTRFLKKVLRNVKTEIVRKSEKQRRRWRPVNVVGYHSGAKSRIGWKELDVAVCTIEKANLLVNAAIEDHSIDDLGIVVFDELHMLEDESRGYILEVLATKLLCLESIPVQIVGMSATLSNVKTIAAWLKAHFYECTFRPVPLKEYLVYNNAIHTHSHTAIMSIMPSERKELKDPVTNSIVSLAHSAVESGHGVLIFCESRKRCEDLSIILIKVLSKPSPEVFEKRMEIVRNLATTPTGLDFALERAVLGGIAFHHAGLTTEERDIVSEAYDAGYIKCICCTPTMAAGVNLPARRVIISPRTGRDFLKPSMLRQMRGRAGRAGKDTFGESYLCCRKEDLPAVQELLDADMPAVTSCLAVETEESSHGLARALLEIIATRLATSSYSINDYFEHTLLQHTHPAPSALPGLLSTALDSLKSMGLIEDGTAGFMAATVMGKATVAAGFPPEEGVFLHGELSRALQNFNLETDLHIVYLFTPTHATQYAEVDWPYLRTCIERLPDADVRTLAFVGISPAFVNRQAQGVSAPPTASDPRTRTYRRFWVALMLRAIINETPVHEVAGDFAVARGFVQSLAASARGFAATSATFCRVMGWTGLAVLLDHYAWRLEVGVRDDLAQLARIVFVKSYTARVFWEAGLRGVEDVAKASLEKIGDALRDARPRKLRLKVDEEERLRDRERERAEIVKRCAERLWEADCQVLLSE